MSSDIVIIGGGIAGVSAAAVLSRRADVVLLEAEATLGYHATGRSAAMYTECTGSTIVRRLAQLSRPFFMDRDECLGSPRGLLFVAPSAESEAIGDVFSRFRPLVPTLERLSPAEVSERFGAIAEDRISGGVLEPGAMDLDVHGVETAFRTEALRNGAVLRTSERVVSIDKHPSGWTVLTSGGSYTCRVALNAAGAWGDVIAAMAGIPPIGLEPLKRSAFIFNPHREVGHWPMVVDTSERWYLKPEGPNLLGSAASEILSQPSDAKPDEIDIALGIERINEATDLGIRSVMSTWAGFRTFTPDRSPAVGSDPFDESFVWLVGQGGYGIKTAPALADLVAALILDGQAPESFETSGLGEADLSPARFVRP